MVFHRPNPRTFVPSNKLSYIEHVDCFTLLGVSFSCILNFSYNVSNTIVVCNQRLYLLTQLKKQGLAVSGSEVVFNALVLSKIVHALPILNGYLSEQNHQQIQAILKKSKKWQLVNTAHNFDCLANTHCKKLFRCRTYTAHCLNHLYGLNTSERVGTLRNHRQSFNTPRTRYDFTSRCFILKSLSEFR